MFRKTTTKITKFDPSSQSEITQVNMKVNADLNIKMYEDLIKDSFQNRELFKLLKLKLDYLHDAIASLEENPDSTSDPMTNEIINKVNNGAMNSINNSIVMEVERLKACVLAFSKQLDRNLERLSNDITNQFKIIENEAKKDNFDISAIETAYSAVHAECFGMIRGKNEKLYNLYYHDASRATQESQEINRGRCTIV